VSHGTVCISLSGLFKPFMQNVNGSVFVTVMNRVTRRAFPIKGDKTIKYMVKNAKARKNLKKSEKNAKKT
jgi:hypothetical protein